MELETKICCCGASRWTQVIAWIDIVCHTIKLFGLGVVLAAFKDSDLKENIAVLIIVFSILGLILAIILLIGTIEERVAYLIAWLIYEGLLICAIGPALVTLHFYKITEIEYSCVRFFVYILVIAFNGFSFVVVYINMKDIKKGVFDFYPKVHVAV